MGGELIWVKERAVRSPSLVEQRQPAQVQQAFNDALKLATSSAYDTTVVDLLLDNGARAEEVFATTLFELEEDPLYHDAFGFCMGMSRVEADDHSEPPESRTGLELG